MNPRSTFTALLLVSVTVIGALGCAPLNALTTRYEVEPLQPADTATLDREEALHYLTHKLNAVPYGIALRDTRHNLKQVFAFDQICIRLRRETVRSLSREETLYVMDVATARPSSQGSYRTSFYFTRETEAGYAAQSFLCLGATWCAYDDQPARPSPLRN